YGCKKCANVSARVPFACARGWSTVIYMLQGGKLSPGFAVRLNLIADPAILIFALHRATAGASGGWPPAFWIAVAVGVWLFVGIALRHYDPSSYDRAAFDDA